MKNNERTRTRRERTFVGTECAVCEEPLEHMLSGEKVLQLSCSHVAHGACFYEYMRDSDSQYCPSCHAPLQLDTTRGGNVLDIGKLNSITRSEDSRSNYTSTPIPWDSQTRASDVKVVPSIRIQRKTSASQLSLSNDGSRFSPAKSHRITQELDGDTITNQQHNVTSSRTVRSRSDSVATGGVSLHGSHKVSAQRTGSESQIPATKPLLQQTRYKRKPIPAPQVTIRSEFPTLTRSRQQQTITCLVTVEVPNMRKVAIMDHHCDQDSSRQLPPYSPQAMYAAGPPSPPRSSQQSLPTREMREEITENLRLRVDNWHGLDFARFGDLRLYSSVRVGKDLKSWQELECFLFADMLICVKEKRASLSDQASNHGPSKYSLKGSILIRKHLIAVRRTDTPKEPLGVTQKITAANLQQHDEQSILSLTLSVAELPQFHLQFSDQNERLLWQEALSGIAAETSSPGAPITGAQIQEQWCDERYTPRVPTSMSSNQAATKPSSLSSHVPIDIVVVVPVNPTMRGVKIQLVRDTLRFMVANLGEDDRLGIVTFGSAKGGEHLVGLTEKAWDGWEAVFSSIRPFDQKIHRADVVVDGANVAMDLLMQRTSTNPISSILLISDLGTSNSENVDFVVSRAEAAKISIHSFGLGMTHKPDTLIELSTRTKASYTYIKDWMMLRECLAGCLGALQSMSHKNVKLKLRLPDGSPARFVKISGALQITKRSTGRDAEASLGDLRFGDKRDILVQLVVAADTSSMETTPFDHWDSVVSGLDALGGPADSLDEEQRARSIEEIALIQADLSWGDLLQEGTSSHLHRPTLLAITMLPSSMSTHKKNTWGAPSPSIPPHPSVILRRMELLTSDMLTRALTLVSRGQHDRAQHLLNETRSILRGLGKGGLPPIPPQALAKSTSIPSPSTGHVPDYFHRTPSPITSTHPHVLSRSQSQVNLPLSHKKSHEHVSAPHPNSGIDPVAVAALDSELESCLEWLAHPAIFARDSRKQALQAISVISSQRGFTFRTPVEELWAGRLGRVKELMVLGREWREGNGEVGEAR